MKWIRPCLVLTACLLVLCCGLYPAAVTVLGQALFPRQASGSLIEQGGKVVGSSLIGQTFDKPSRHPEYFWGRPSAASADPATGVMVSQGSNYGPLNATLEDEVAARETALRATGVAGPLPADLVTKSGSGLDPHVSVSGAEVQVVRVAKARGMSVDALRALVREHTEGRTLGLLGEERVNVLELNLALDQPPNKVASEPRPSQGRGPEPRP